MANQCSTEHTANRSGRGVNMLQRMRHRRLTQIAGDSVCATYAKARAKVRAAHEAEEQADD